MYKLDSSSNGDKKAENLDYLNIRRLPNNHTLLVIYYPGNIEKIDAGINKSCANSNTGLYDILPQNRKGDKSN